MPEFDQKHTIYEERFPTWKYNRDHFHGGRHLLRTWSPFGEDKQNYLTMHEVEKAETYAQRKQRAPGLYTNMLEHALLVYRSHILRVPPKRTDLPPVLDPLTFDADLFGTSADHFFENVFEESQLQGICYVLVDAPAQVRRPTQADARRNRLRPWFELVAAEKLIDWEIERDDPLTRGMLKYIVIKDTVVRRPGPFMEPEERARYRVWTPTEWQRWEGEESNVGLVASGPNALGRVPLVPCYDKYLAPMSGATNLDEVARKSNALWNRSSVRDENFYRQGFSLLVIASDTYKAKDAADLSAARGLLLGSGEQATFQSPDASIFKAYTDFARELIEQSADHIFGRTQRHQLPTAQVESGHKRELDVKPFESLLEAKTSSIEECERGVWEMAAAYYGIEAKIEDEIWTTYTRDYRIDDLEADEWIKRIANSVSSPVEWRMALHPEETEEEASEFVRSNESEFGGPPPEPPTAPSDDDEEDEGEERDEADGAGTVTEPAPNANAA